MRSEHAFSEVLGVIIMIGVVMAGVSLIGVKMMSQPQPEKIPEVTFQAGVKNDILYLYHDGGDTLAVYDQNNKNALKNANFRVLIDNEEWPVDDLGTDRDTQANDHFILVNSGNSSPQSSYIFNNGDRLEAPVSHNPQIARVIYKGSSGNEQVIWTGKIEEGANFYVNDRLACQGEPIQFYDGSNNNPDSWEWNFNAERYYDGQVWYDSAIDKTGKNPTWTYTQPGIYTVVMNSSNGYGNYSVTKSQYIDVDCVHADFTYSPRTGEEPLAVSFTDTSRCSPTSRQWNFGDGNSSTVQNPQNVYVTQVNGVPSTYPVTLTVQKAGCSAKSKTAYITVNPICSLVNANFGYKGRRDIDDTLVLELEDYSQSNDTVDKWLWDFGDGTVSNEQNPIHEYPNTNYTITLTAGNDCGKYGTFQRKITFPCTNITASILSDPSPPTGPAPLTVNFTDMSDPVDKISSWRWSFGDGGTYYSDNATTRNPPTHVYDRVGTYYVSVMVQNECGQAFFKTPIVVVSQDAGISGTIWDDKNMNTIQDAGDSLVSGWPVRLEERVAGTWNVVNTTTTNTSGYYNFDMKGVSNSVFRIATTIPSDWKVTSSYGSVDKNVSDNLLIYNQRYYNDVNFGLVQRHTSSIQVPGSFRRYQGTIDKGVFYYYSSLGAAARFLDYNTTYNLTPRVVFLYPDSNSGYFSPDPPGGYPSGYTTWGNSSFTLSIREYNNYLKTVGSGAYFLDWWKYNGVNYVRGKEFPVPDNTSISASQLVVTYLWDASNHFDIDKPKEGSVIPFTTAYGAEAHFEGDDERTDSASTRCAMTTPVTSTVYLPYNSTVGEYTGTINTTPFEGTTQRFTVRMWLVNGSYMYTYSNATIGWEPITAEIKNISSDLPYIAGNPAYKYVKGITSVRANVTGKWQDNTSVTLRFNDGSSIPMTIISSYKSMTTLGCSFDAELYAGKDMSLVVRAPYQAGKGTEGPYVNSPAWNVTALSKTNLIANFTADPFSGPVPHEVSFTDLSTGGPNVWLWIFGDGTTSTEKNPIHIFPNPTGYNGTGSYNYTVRLQVTNASPATMNTTRNISISGLWHNANLMTSRSSALALEGYMKWIVRGFNSFIMVNGTNYPLSDGDIVQISLMKPHSAGRIFVAGEITDCNLSNISLIINGVPVGQGNISSIRIKDYENFHSNLTLSAEKNYNAWVSFQWDGIPIPTSWKKRIVLSDLMPNISTRYMNLEMASTQTYVDSIASMYQFQ